MHDPQETLHLGGVDGILADELTEQIEIQGLAQRQQPQRGHRLAAGVLEAPLQQRGQPGGDARIAAQLPETVDLSELAAFERSLHHVPQEQRIAGRGVPYDVSRQTFQGSTEHPRDEVDALRLGERRELEQLDVTVFPQRGDGIGDSFTAAHSGDDARAVLQCDLVQQRCRQLIEQVRVVDADYRVPVGE